jgi:hypothetical protein
MYITKKQLRNIIKETWNRSILHVIFLPEKNSYKILGRYYNRDNLKSIAGALMHAKERGYSKVTGFDSYGSIDDIDETINRLIGHTLGY